jgi:hypothetical protein
MERRSFAITDPEGVGPDQWGERSPVPSVLVVLPLWSTVDRGG